jgi:uncharacterized protein (TIGR03382 family)
MRKFFALLAAMAIAACASSDDRQPEPAVATAPAELVTAFGPGSLIIPMDTTYQDAGTLRAFGLVYRLLQNNVPVHWVVLTGKANQGIDFTIAAPSTVRTRTALGAGVAVAVPASYRGGPFVIDAADAAAALPIIAAWKATEPVTTPTVVHELTAGSFSADVQRTLTAAPKVGVFQDGAEAIAYADLNAAGIPDSTGAAWAAGSADELSEAELRGPTGDGNTGGSGADGVLNAGGTQNYCHITSMHWDGSPNGAAVTNEVVREVRTWLDSSTNTHGFMQCAAIRTFENSPRGRFITTAGIVEDTNNTLPEAGQSLVNRIPDDLLAQYHGPIVGDSGSVGSIGLNGGGSDYRPNTEILINQSNASTALANAARVMWASGYLDGNTANGRVTYLAGHNFSVTTPISTNAQTNGVRLLLNSIFESPCALATGQPNLTLTKTAPATTAGNTITFTLAYANTGNAPAYNAVLTDVIPVGTTFNAASGGGTFALGTVTWNLGTLAIGATGSVTLTVNVLLDGTYANSATLNYRAGTTPRTATSNTTSTTRDADVPVANPDAFTVAEDSSTALNVRANDTGLGDPPIVTTIAAAPANGTATVNAGGTIQYTPNANFTGTDTFQYTITDATNQSSTATVTVTVTPVNDPPTAGNDAATVAEDSGATVVNVLANDATAPDTGETLTVTAVTQPAAGGAVTLVGGVVRFTPAANFSGTTTFTYTVSDGNGGTATATVTVTVTAVNDPPTANNDAVTVVEDSAATVVNVLANDTTAPDTGETLTVTAVTQPATGTVTLVGGVVRFTPAANFSGTTTFTYTVSDGNGGTATATVTVTVTAVNDPPTANNDAVTVVEDSAATVVNVLANDTTAPDTGETLTVTAVTQPATGGTVTLAGGVVRFTPAANFSGTTTFTYTVSDGNGGTATATVTVTVTAVNDAPDAVNDAFTVAENSAATSLDVLANDTAAPDSGETLTVTAVTQPANGTVTFTAGAVTFTPPAGFNGTTTFTYTISDGNGGTDTATVTVTVTAVNDPPTANADAITVAEDSGATAIDVLANDSIAPDTGETLTVTAVTQPATGGTVTLVGGAVRFTPAPNFFGTATFTYTISDGNGGTATGTVTVTVTPVNDPPTAVADSASVPRDAPATVVDVLANDTSAPDGPETLTVTAVTQPATGGTVTLTGGVVSFTPAPGFVGTATFTYTISDGNGGTATATVTMQVLAPDRDGDGIPDDDETAGGSDPDDADTDDDGVIDGDEPMPYVDTDGDGLTDVRDPDSDNDGLYDGTELGVTTPDADTDVGAGHFIPDGDAGATTTDPLDRDTDDGGVPDGAEDTDKDGVVDPGERDPNVAADDVTPPADDDMDGLTNAEEAELGTDPQDADSDDDGVLDGAEANYADDTDGDGLINPLDPDSDNDGLFDGTEVGVTTAHADTDVGAGHFRPDADPATHTSMVDRDTDHGGVPDGAEDTDKDGQVDTGERDPLDPADDATPPADDDMDGLTNAEEAELGTDPQDADSDDDGVIDGAEANYSDDTDGDGLINPLDPDSDNDGLFDGTETGVTTPNADTDVGAGHFTPDADPSTHTGPLDPDTDDGGVPDGAEDVNHNGRIDGTETDPLDPADDSTVVDDDGDGLSNPEEAELGTDPQDADSDDDGVLDGAEANYGDDTDGDGMINPLDPDSDNDGITDGTEVGVTTPHPDTDTTAGHFTPDADPATHTSMVVTDTDHGGVPDGEEDTDHDGQVDAGERDPLDPADDQPLDRDHDGVLDVVDNCPDTANPDQDDPDHDGLGSACDDDDDGDGFVDGYGVSGGGCSTGGGQGGGGLAVLALAVAGVIVRRRRRVAAAATVAGLTALVPVAAAQVASEKQDFSIERFELSSDTGGILGVEGAGLGARWAWDVHLWLGSANDPLVVYMDDGGRERVGSLVSQRTGGELGASLVLHERLGLGLDAPLIVAQSRDAMVPGVVGTLGDVGGVGLGDLRLSPKLRLLRQGHEGVDVALVPELTLPTGAGENYRGDDGASFAPYLALSRRHARVRWALDLGYAFRRQTGVGGLVVDDELRAKAGVGVQVVRRVELAATVSAATAAKAPFDDFARNHLEVVGGPVASLRGGWQLFGAGGVGLRQGYGTPDWRALAGVRVGVGDDGGPVDWDHDGLIATDQCPRDPEDKDAFQDEDGCSDPDNDDDGVLDVADGAPMDPEDKDDFEDTDGVPDPDNDQDGIADAGDDCPIVAENVNGYQDEDGCPDEKDSDGDGNPDTTDQCPTDPEDVDKFQDEDGCPDDNDGDGVPDATDACPSEPGPVENQGCPDKDRDADTVVDRLDNCPDEPGTVANHGCKEKQLAVLNGSSIEILDVVYFKTNKDIIQKRSFKLLSSVAAIIANHPELPSITIEGHTDDRGDDAYNLDLSQRRAEAVRRFLIGKGIDGARLEAKGYGETKPIKPNDTNANRSANRRVEFKVGDVASANSGPTTDTMDKDPKTPAPGELP